MPRKSKTLDAELSKSLREFKPDITESTLRIYNLNLSQLADYYDKPLSPELFKNFKEIRSDLEELKYTNATLKNKVSAIIVYLRMTKQSKELINEYTDYFDMLSGRISKDHAKMDKTKKESDNWMTKEELNKYLEDLKKELPAKPTSKNDMSKWMKYITLLIHINYPFRNELADTEIVNKITNNDPNINYITVTKDKVSALIQAYKTRKTYKDIKINFIPSVADEIRTYYKHLIKYKKLNQINNDWLLLAKDGGKMTRNDFTYFVKSIFEPLGKNISTTMIRKIIVSSLYPVEQMKALAQTMGHDVQTSLTYYAKE
jgi:hypothetical protein